ncbi:myo-inosose-2 dehydratase [Paraburkholderia sp. Ac-20347]|uniref:myo-inosose-2 dehydratase n=1 Tax=Paraburkholderia sp. Ac-20347 TaxID=2703892 RepID=UPI001981B6F6|nr:myo-inosose-2 dehydratase [Paraburkholderia sp. Ac-20347]MBN3812515.1 myo-inosose-2 dehydratase [Paraburkholderia sp. Ac-20347]
MQDVVRASQTQFNVRIGASPIGWCNDDLPSLGTDTTLETMLSDGQKIGYEGFELGGRFPRNRATLAGILEQYRLRLVSGWYSGRLAERSVEQEWQAVSSHADLLVDLGCDVLVYGEVADSVQGRIEVPLSMRPRFDSANAFAGYCARLSDFSTRLADRGLRLAYHHHMGAYVESPDEIDRLMAGTCDDVGLAFDTGHIRFGGGDPLEMLRRHIDRVRHVHCKDVRAPILAEARNRDWSFLTAVLQGAFTVPGDGDIDFAPLIDVLREHGYQGWLVVEAEQDPAVAPSYTYADKGFRTLRLIVDAVAHC